MLKQRESLKTYFKNKQTDRQTKAKPISVYVYGVYGVAYTTVCVCVVCIGQKTAVRDS